MDSDWRHWDHSFGEYLVQNHLPEPFPVGKNGERGKWTLPRLSISCTLPECTHPSLINLFLMKKKPLQKTVTDFFFFVLFKKEQ